LTGERGHRYTPPASVAGRQDSGDPWAGVSTGWAISSYLLSGVVVWGGIGYLVDRLVGTPHVFLAIGMVAGAVLGTYLIWLRYGRGDEAKKQH
jgi:ATP synthase protein I